MSKKIRLRDTRGNWSLGIRLPNKDYKPKLTKQERLFRNRQAVRNYTLRNREEKRKEWSEYQKNWRKENPKKAAEYSKTWRLKHPEEKKSRNKAYYLNNKERWTQYHRKYRLQNKKQEGFNNIKSGSKT